MHLLTAAEMRAVDEATVAAGTPVATLMERAGRGVAATIERVFGSPLAWHVRVYAGGGHNGGDGLVAARALAERGAQVTVVLCATRLAAATQDLLTGLDGTRVRVHHAPDEAAFAALATADAPCDLVIDALLGTGAAGPPRGTVALAWLLKHPAGIVPIVGSTKPEKIREGANAPRVELTREEWYRLLLAARGEPLP